MKKILAIALAIAMVLTICIGTALAKNDNNKDNSKDKPKVTDETKKNNNNDKDKDTGSKKNDNKNSDKVKGKVEAQKKQDLKNSFKTAVAPYLSQIKANKRAWGQAGGLGELEGMQDNIENMLESIISGNVVITPEQLAAISAEIQKIKAYKNTLRSDKSAMNAAWHKYITAKKTYDIAAATAALQNTIALQLKRIDARKGIFASMANIAAIIKAALAAPPPAPSPSPSPDPSATPPAETSPAPNDSPIPSVA